MPVDNNITLAFCGIDGWHVGIGDHAVFPLAPCVREMIIIVPTVLLTLVVLLPRLITLSIALYSIKDRVLYGTRPTRGQLTLYLLTQFTLFAWACVAVFPSPLLGDDEEKLLWIYLISGSVQCFAVSIVVAILAVEWRLRIHRSMAVHVYAVLVFLFSSIQEASLLAEELLDKSTAVANVYHVQYLLTVTFFFLTTAISCKPSLQFHNSLTDVNDQLRHEQRPDNVLVLALRLCGHLSMPCVGKWMAGILFGLARGVFLVFSEFKIGEIANAIVEAVDETMPQSSGADVTDAIMWFSVYTALQITCSLLSGLLIGNAISETVLYIRRATANDALFDVEKTFDGNDRGLTLRSVLTTDCEKLVATSVYPFRTVSSALSALTVGAVLMIQGNWYLFLGNMAAVSIIIAVIFFVNNYAISHLSISMSMEGERVSAVADEILGCLSTILLFSKEGDEKENILGVSHRASKSISRKFNIELLCECVQWTLGNLWIVLTMFLCWQLAARGHLDSDAVFSYFVLGIQMLHSSLLLASYLPSILFLAGPLTHILSILPDRQCGGKHCGDGKNHCHSHRDDPSSPVPPPHLTANYHFTSSAHAINAKYQSTSSSALAISSMDGAMPQYDYFSTPGIVLEGVVFQRRPSNAKTMTAPFFTRRLNEERPTPQCILYGIDLIIDPGMFVGVVGSSGCGKTTLLNIIMGMLRPTAGNVYVTGEHCCRTNVQDIDRKRFSPLVGILEQRPAVFDGTIAYNLTYGLDPEFQLVDDANDLQELVEVALRDAAVYDLVKKVGLKYQVGPRGKKLSVGQNQRLCLARVLLRNPKLLLLDESTSALDQHSERQIINALQRRRAESNMTIISVAHRINTIKDADCIIVMKEGNIVAKGKHEELLDTCPEYQAMHNSPVDEHVRESQEGHRVSESFSPRRSYNLSPFSVPQFHSYEIPVEEDPLVVDDAGHDPVIRPQESLPLLSRSST